MPSLTSQISGAQWTHDGPQTPVQRFFAEYAKTVDSYGFTQGSGSRYYAAEVVFHNQNNAEYRGGDQMWAWMKKLFGQFERLRHDILNVWEIGQDDGESLLFVQMTRNIWTLGNRTEKPEVSAPTSWICRIGKADSADGFEGLQFREVWLYWDTMLLAPFLPKDAIAFRTENVVE